MDILELTTVAIHPQGCFSVLKNFDGLPFAVSVERTFDDGFPVIRAGMHKCKRSFFHKGGYETFEIEVTGHSLILFHKGNTEEDSIGCICLAESFGSINNATAVIDSKHGFEEFMQLTKCFAEFYLNVKGR